MSRRFGYFHLIAALVVGLIVGTGLMSLPAYFKKSNGPWEDWKSVSQHEIAINDCLVQEMRKRASNMIATVYEVCAERNGSNTMRPPW
jgi:hypothetical protein